MPSRPASAGAAGTGARGMTSRASVSHTCAGASARPYPRGHGLRLSELLPRSARRHGRIGHAHRVLQPFAAIGLEPQQCAFPPGCLLGAARPRVRRPRVRASGWLERTFAASSSKSSTATTSTRSPNRPSAVRPPSPPRRPHRLLTPHPLPGLRGLRHPAKGGRPGRHRGGHRRRRGQPASPQTHDGGGHHARSPARALESRDRR